MARWREALGRSADTLRTLAREAVEEYRAGRTEPLDPNAP